MCYHVVTKSIHCDNQSHANHEPVLYPKMWLQPWQKAAMCPKRELVIELAEECGNCQGDTHAVEPWEDHAISSPATDVSSDFEWSTSGNSDSDSMEEDEEIPDQYRNSGRRPLEIDNEVPEIPATCASRRCVAE